MNTHHDRFRGQIWLSPDGVVDGICVDESRPDLRCWVEILVEDRIAATALARENRDDPSALGLTDRRHGFRVVLPAALLPPRPEIMVWARVKGARLGFAQRLLVRPGLIERDSPREAALAGQIADLSDRLERLARLPARPPGAVLRERMGELAALLGGRRRPVPDLPYLRHPAVTLALPVGADVAEAWRRLLWLAPIARTLNAEILAVHDGAAPHCLILPSLVPNLRIVAAVPDMRRAAAAAGRGARIVALDPDDPLPTLASLAAA